MSFFNTPQPFWQNGPAPGAFYDFPNSKATPTAQFSQRSQTPITTATSVVAIKYKDGVMIAADMLGSYGSLARFRNCPRVMKINENIICGVGGDYADFQYLQDVINQKIIDEQCLDDGFSLKPKSLYCWLTRILYNRRSKFDPFWNNFIIGGIQNNEVFLGTVDKLGTAFEDNHIATGYGAYIALPLLRNAYEKNKNMTKAEAKELLTKCMQVLFYRDARSYPKFDIVSIDKSGAEIESNISVPQNWEIATLSRN